MFSRHPNWKGKLWLSPMHAWTQQNLVQLSSTLIVNFFAQLQSLRSIYLPTSENKQKISEVLKCLAELGSEEVRRAHQANNAAAIQQAQNLLTQFPLSLGIDLRQYRLTDQGFTNG